MLSKRRRAVARLETASIAIEFPADLSGWFESLVRPTEPAVKPNIRLIRERDTDTYTIKAPAGIVATGLELGEALAVFWERMAYFLIDGVTNGLALHAASVRRGGQVVLIAGASGAGKTHLALWYRDQGFDLGSDEITTVRSEGTGADARLTTSTLSRPVVLKTSADIAGHQIAPRVQPFYGGSMLFPDRATGWASESMERGILLLPRFSAGAAFELRELTPGEAALEILNHCLNVRNLPKGGLPLAAAVARRVKGISLVYGDSRQLKGKLDVLTRVLLAGPVSPADLADLCRAFNSIESADPGRDASQLSTTTAAATTRRPAPATTAKRFPRRLTIGMATYDDYDGAYFTLQNIRLGNPSIAGDLEFLIVDNNPGGVFSEALSRLAEHVDGCRYIARGDWSGTAIRNAVFEEASSPYALCVDSHVLIAPGAVAKLVDYFEADPDTRDLLQGPMVHDDLLRLHTHMEPQWRAGMFGTWGFDERGMDADGPAFEIPLHGLGLFAARKDCLGRVQPALSGIWRRGGLHPRKDPSAWRADALSALSAMAAPV